MLRNEKGESLIELLMSVALLSFLAMIIMASLAIVARRNIMNESRLSATYVAQQETEFLFSTSMDKKEMTKDEMLAALEQRFSDTSKYSVTGFSGSLTDAKGRAYEKTENENGEANKCTEYVFKVTHTSRSETPGFTETITIVFNYYYGGLSKVICEAEKDGDYAKNEAAYSWNYKK